MQIEDFTIKKNKGEIEYVDWNEIEMKLGKERCWEFKRWMCGQACVLTGVFPEDLKRFLNNLPAID